MGVASCSISFENWTMDLNIWPTQTWIVSQPLPEFFWTNAAEWLQKYRMGRGTLLYNANSGSHCVAFSCSHGPFWSVLGHGSWPWLEAFGSNDKVDLVLWPVILKDHPGGQSQHLLSTKKIKKTENSHVTMSQFTTILWADMFYHFHQMFMITREDAKYMFVWCVSNSQQVSTSLKWSNMPTIFPFDFTFSRVWCRHFRTWEKDSRAKWVMTKVELISSWPWRFNLGPENPGIWTFRLSFLYRLKGMKDDANPCKRTNQLKHKRLFMCDV